MILWRYQILKLRLSGCIYFCQRLCDETLFQTPDRGREAVTLLLVTSNVKVIQVIILHCTVQYGAQTNIGKSNRLIHISRSKSYKLKHIHIFFSRICFHPNIFSRMINYPYFIILIEFHKKKFSNDIFLRIILQRLIERLIIQIEVCRLSENTSISHALYLQRAGGPFGPPSPLRKNLLVQLV